MIWKTSYPSALKEIFAVFPGLEDMLEELKKDPPSGHIHQILRARLITFLLFCDGKPFARDEVKLIMRVVCGRNCTSRQVGEFATRILHDPAFVRHRTKKGFWRVVGPIDPVGKGRPPKPGEISFCEWVFRRAEEAWPPEWLAPVRLATRKELIKCMNVIRANSIIYRRIRGGFLRMKVLRRDGIEHKKIKGDFVKKFLIRRTSLKLDQMTNLSAFVTLCIFRSLITDGLVSDEEIRLATKRFRSTTLADFMGAFFFFGSGEKERLEPLARMARERVSLFLRYAKEFKTPLIWPDELPEK